MARARPHPMTPIEYRARGLGYYERRLERLHAIDGPLGHMNPAEHYYRVTQAALSALEKGRQRAGTPGWLADCLKAHECAARQVR